MTPEEKQRIEQIRERHLRVDCYKSQMRTDIDFLLSLVKSQEAGDGGDVRMLNQIRKHAADGYERASGGSEVKAANLMLNDLHYVLSSHDGQFARGCTSMRSACVEKVKAMRSEWLSKVSEEWDDRPDLSFDAAERVAAADKIINALESLSIEKPKE